MRRQETAQPRGTSLGCSRLLLLHIPILHRAIRRHNSFCNRRPQWRVRRRHLCRWQLRLGCTSGFLVLRKRWNTFQYRRQHGSAAQARAFSPASSSAGLRRRGSGSTHVGKSGQDDGASARVVAPLRGRKGGEGGEMVGCHEQPQGTACKSSKSAMRSLQLVPRCG